MPFEKRKRWQGLSARVIALGLVASASSCGEKFCVEGLDIGTTYRVTVLEPANANSQYGVQTSNGPDFGIGMSISDFPTCGAGFDFVAGSTFLIEPVSWSRQMRTPSTLSRPAMARISG